MRVEWQLSALRLEQRDRERREGIQMRERKVKGVGRRSEEDRGGGESTWGGTGTGRRTEVSLHLLHRLTKHTWRGLMREKIRDPSRAQGEDRRSSWTSSVRSPVCAYPPRSEPRNVASRTTGSHRSRAQRVAKMSDPSRRHPTIRSLLVPPAT